MTLTITATIVPGQGDAATNHRVLIPRIAAGFPEVAKCSAFGTINVWLDRVLNRSHADFWTSHIAWLPAKTLGGDRALRLEAFGFIRIAFECPIDGPRCAAWIMLPEGSELTYRADQAEIIAGEFVAAASNGARCAIHLDHTPTLPAPSWFGENYGKSLNQSSAASGLET
ncbi:MAG: hypothetical protein ACTHLX_10940 [Candidatus Binatia bacterium]